MIPFEKVKASDRKLEADDLELPKKTVLRPYEERKAPAEFVSTVEEHQNS